MSCVIRDTWQSQCTAEGKRSQTQADENSIPDGASTQDDRSTSAPLPKRSSLPTLIGLKSNNIKKSLDDERIFKDICAEISKQLHWHKEFGIIAATGVAKVLLMQENYELALRALDFLKDEAEVTDRDRYIIFGNIAYCLVGMGLFEEAIQYGCHVRKLRKAQNEDLFSWHSMNLAYSYFRTRRLAEYYQELQYAKSRPEYDSEIDFCARIYPEIATDL